MTNDLTKISCLVDQNDTMADDELAIVYYIANLILQEQFSLADSIIQRQLLHIRLSHTFNGNIRRL